jgi:hypothetical protein
MYASSDDARSDLFLSGAVYLFGPLILGVLFDIVPVMRVPMLGPLLSVILPLATTVLVPFLLIRYRGEPLSMYGLGRSGTPSFATGALLGGPVAGAAVVGALGGGQGIDAALPITWLAGGGGVLALLARLAQWLGLALLAIYGTVKARDALRGDPVTVREAALEIGRYVAIAAAGASLLLVVALVTRGSGVEALVLLLSPLGVAGAGWLALRQLRQAVTTRNVLLTPVVLLALGPFTLSLNAFTLVFGVWLAALYAGIGLIIGALQESRRDAYAAVGLAIVLACLTTLGQSL